MTDAWYPLAEDYYVDNTGASSYPVRQGDLFGPVSILTDTKGKPWTGCQVVHPSCEIVAKTEPPNLLVIRVRRLTTVSEKHQTAIANGYTDSTAGRRVAWAHTFFLPPVGVLFEPMYSDFRTVAVIPRDLLNIEHRMAALTHDSRVLFIRRKLYWEQRWLLRTEAVQSLEADRIRMDTRFQGPRPSWV